MTFFSTDFQVSILPSKGQAQLEDQLQTVRNTCKSFETFYLSNADAPLRNEIRVLSGLITFGEGNSKWSDIIPEGIGWSQFFAATASTLRRINKINLITSVQSVDKVPCFVAG